MKWKLLREASYAGSCICALATMQCTCVLAEYPQAWAVALGLALLFGILAACLYHLAQRIDRALHMTRLQILQAAQASKKEMPARSSNYGQAKVAN